MNARVSRLSTPGVGGYVFRLLNFCATVHCKYKWLWQNHSAVKTTPLLSYLEGLSGSKRTMGEVCVDPRNYFLGGVMSSASLLTFLTLLSTTSGFTVPLTVTLFVHWQQSTFSTPAQIHNTTKPTTIRFLFQEN